MWQNGGHSHRRDEPCHPDCDDWRRRIARQPNVVVVHGLAELTAAILALAEVMRVDTVTDENMAKVEAIDAQVRGIRVD